jgi:hypothetical protein
MKILKTIAVLLLCSVPLMAATDFADNVLIEPNATAVNLDRFPTPGAKFSPGTAPNATLTPFRSSEESWPGYFARYRTLRYVLAVSCGPITDEPCRRVRMGNFKATDLTIAYVQTSDVHFTTDEGLMIGDSLNTVMQKIPVKEPWYTGNGECIRLPSGWNACFYIDDLVYDSNRGIYRPKENAKVFRFLKDLPS